MSLSPAHKRGLICAILASIIFGVYPSSLRAAYADGANAGFIIMLTTWARALSMMLYCVKTRTPLFENKEVVKQAIIGGVFQAISIFSILLALRSVPGPIVIIIVFSHTLMLLFFMAWRGEIKLDKTNLVTTVMALLGLTLVLDVWHTQPCAQWVGFGLAFLAALATVSRMYVYGHQTRTRHPIAVGAENFLVAAVITLIVPIFQVPHAPESSGGYFYALLACFALGGGSFCMFFGISLLGSFQYSLFAKIEPIFTSIFSVLILGEILMPHQYLGIALVIGSLAAYQILRQRQKPVL